MMLLVLAGLIPAAAVWAALRTARARRARDLRDAEAWVPLSQAAPALYRPEPSRWARTDQAPTRHGGRL